jgi:hypothetical protein
VLRRVIFLAMLALALAPRSNAQCNSGSALAVAACAMAPGTWVQLTTNNFNSGNILRPPNGGSGLEFDERVSWDAINNRVLILGGSHPASQTACGATYLAAYTESTNAWVNNLPNPCPNYDDSEGLSAGIPNLVHPYDQSAAMDSQYNLYHRQYDTGKVMVFTNSTQSWSQCTPYNTEGDTTNSWVDFGEYQAAGSLVYFPDRNSIIYLDGDWGLWELPLGTGSSCTGLWTLRASTNGGGFTPQLTGLGSYQNVGQYSALCHCVVIGGNSNQFYKIDASFNITSLSTTPVFIGIPQNPGTALGAIYTVDPVTGHFIVWSGNGSDNGKMYDYNPLTDTWTATGIAPPASLFPGPEGGVCETVAVPIPKYGVIMVIQAGSSAGGSVWLYKNATPNTFTARTAGTNNSGTILSNEPFETASHIPTCSGPSFPCSTYAAGNQYYTTSYQTGTPAQDCTVAADGSCSLKFTVTSGSFQGDSGYYDYNFCPPGASNTCLAGAGQEIFVQYKLRLDPAILGTFSGAGGLKHDITTEGDTATVDAPDCSNSPGEIVTIQDLAGFSGPWMYVNCGYSSGSLNFTNLGYSPLQLPGAPDSNFLDQDASGCPHYANQGITISDPQCFIYVGDEWFTIQKHIKVGAFGTASSVIEQWFSHAQVPAVLVSNAADAAIPNDGSGGATGKYGKIQLSTYNTGANWTVNTAAWFDDLIVSTRRIPDPETNTPNGPDSLSLSGISSSSITLNWRVNSNNSTPQDDIGFVVQRCTGTAPTCFPNPGSGFTTIATTAAHAATYTDSTVTSGTTYTYRVAATNTAGNSAFAEAICFNNSGTCGGTAQATGGGGGGSPAVGISPSPSAFGSQAQAIASSPLTVTISNTGTAALVLSSPYYTISGTNAADFSNNGSGTCTNGGTVNTSSSCTAVLVFTPSIIGAESGTFTINGNASGSANLTGTGIAAMTFAPSPIAFVPQAVGVPSSPGTVVTVSNAASTSLTLATPYFTIAGSGAASFSNLGTGTCANGGTLPVGGSCTIVLSFTPAAAGAVSATLNVSCTSSTDTDSITGTGVAVINLQGIGTISGVGVIKP